MPKTDEADFDANSLLSIFRDFTLSLNPGDNVDYFDSANKWSLSNLALDQSTTKVTVSSPNTGLMTSGRYYLITLVIEEKLANGTIYSSSTLDFLVLYKFVPATATVFPYFVKPPTPDSVSVVIGCNVDFRVTAANPAKLGGNALKLWGSPSSAALPQSVKTTSISLEAWVRYNTTAISNTVVLGSTKSSGTGLAILVRSGFFAVQLRRGSVCGSANCGLTLITDTLVPINTGVWYHLVATYAFSTNALSLFVDGRTVSTAYPVQPTDATQSIYWESDAPIYAGYSQANGIYMTGHIDDIRVYNRSLSQAEVVSNRNSNFTSAISKGLIFQASEPSTQDSASLTLTAGAAWDVTVADVCKPFKDMAAAHDRLSKAPSCIRWCPQRHGRVWANLRRQL